MRLKLRDIEIFATVAACNSVQLAAERIGMTQSAVTRSIQRVEDTLGHPLFDRSARPLGLTRDGQLALQRARDALSAADRMEHMFAARSGPSGPFRLGVPHALTHLLFRHEGLLGLEAYTGLDPSIFAGWSNDLHNKLASGALDAAITIDARTPARAAALRVDPLMSAPLSVVSAAHTVSEARSLEAANAIGWALNPDGCGYRSALEEALDAQGLQPNLRLETNSLDVQFTLAARGTALTLAPQFAVGYLSERYNVSFLTPDYLQKSLLVHLAVSTSRDALQPVADDMLRAATTALR